MAYPSPVSRQRLCHRPLGRSHSLGRVSAGLLSFHPFAAAAFSPCLPNPNPPNLAPGAVVFSGLSGAPECCVVERESVGGCD